MNAFTPNPTRLMKRHHLLIFVLPLIAAGCAGSGSSGGNPPRPNPEPGGNSPVVNAGVDQVVDTGASVTLNGSASSDPDGDTISFVWEQKLGTPVSLNGATVSLATFTAPANGTTLAFDLTVSDGKNNSVGRSNVSVHPVDPSAQVIEVHQRPVTDDPAVNGDFEKGWTRATLPETPQPDPPDFDIAEGAFALLNAVQFAPPVEVQLAPKATHEVELQVGGPSVLMGSVRWDGTTSPLEITMSLEGSPVTTVTSYGLGTNRGGSALAARTAAGGRATLSVTNTSTATVTVKMTFGALGL